MIFEFLLQPEISPFFTALCAVAAISVIEIVSLILFGVAGISSVLSHALHLDHTAEFPGVNWLVIKNVPFMASLVAMLTGFGLAGITLQSVVFSQVGSYMPVLFAATAGAVGGLATVRALGALVNRTNIAFDSNAVSLKSLVGRTALHLTPVARFGFPGQAELFDGSGTRHYVFIEPEAVGTEIPMGAKVELISFDGQLFQARVVS